MRKLGRLIANALDDSVRAQELVADGRARRAVREDPDFWLGSFASRAGEIEEVSSFLLTGSQPRRPRTRALRLNRARA